MAQWRKHQQRNQRIAELLTTGESISFVAKTMGCSKSTVSYWADKLGSRSLPRNVSIAKRKTNCGSNSGGCAALRRNWATARAEVIAEATNNWPSVRQNPDMMAFLGIYWGEGLKSGSIAGVVNCDPGVIKLCWDCLNLLSKNVGTTRWSVVVRVYPLHDRSECSLFWRKLLGVEPVLYPKEWKQGRQKLQAKYGTCTIRVHDWRLRLKLLTWFNLWRSEILGRTFRPDPTVPNQDFLVF